MDSPLKPHFPRQTTYSAKRPSLGKKASQTPPKVSKSHPNFFWGDVTYGHLTFCKKNGSNLIYCGLRSSISNLQTHIGGRHSMLVLCYYLSKYFFPSLQRSMPILGVDNKCFSPKGKCIIVYCLFQQNFNFHLAGSVATIKHSQSAFQHLFYTFSNEMQYIDTMILSG